VKVKNIVANRFDFLVEAASESIVRGMQPDFTLLGKIPVHGVIVTSRAGAGDSDFVSRFFGPAVGSNEDPATGSAHCFLSPDFRERLEGFAGERARLVSCLAEGIVVFHSLSRYNSMANHRI
jgi:predicted PhzF superfamily epimerase YddE/YHI9